MEAYQAKFGAPLDAAEDLGGLRPDRPVHHRPAGARTSTAPGTSARRAARATSSTSCSSSAPTAAQLFDDNMKAQLASHAGVKTLQNMLAANDASIPGNNELDAVSLWAAFLTGKVAMIYSWPPSGRMAATTRRATRRSTSSRSPRSPARSATRSCRAIRSTPPASTRRSRPTRPNPEAAYLFMQWVTSPPVSLARVHAALRAARSVPAVALQVRALRRALARTRRNTSSTSTTRPMSACSTRSCPARRTTS